MDSKTLRLSIVAVITSLILIAVVVYAANIDRIGKLVGKDSSNEEVPEEEVVEETVETDYGEQIGDNLKGFLTADDFFDKSEQRPSVVVVVDNVPVPANASSEEDTTDITEFPDAEDDFVIREDDEASSDDSAEADSSGDTASSDKSTEDISGNNTEDTSDKSTEDISGENTADTSDKSTEDISGNSATDSSDNSTEEASSGN